MRRIHSPFLPRLIRILAFVTAVAMTVPAAAQGADGVANPMSLRSVIDLLSRYTDLEPRQRLDVEEAHDRYLEAFERLRDGRIQDFMDLSHRTEAGSSGSMPSLEQMEKLFAEWEDVNRRVASLDTRFLEEIGAVLDARQADALSRVGLIRGRERHMASNSMLSRSLGQGIDKAFWKIGPTEEEMVAVDDILRGYEAVMPRLVEDHSKASVGMVREILQHVNEAGFTDLTAEDMQDPETVMNMMAAMEEAQRLAMTPMHEAKTAIEDRGLSAARGFRSRLAPDRWYRMKRIWMSSAFPGTGMGLTGGSELDVPGHAKAIRAELAGDPDRIESLEAMLRNWYAGDDRHTDELIEFTRMQAAREFLDPMNVGNMRPDDIRSVHTARRESAERAIRSMMELVSDPEVRAAIRKRVLEGGAMIVQAGVEIPIQPREEVAPDDRGSRSRISTAKAAANIPVPISTEDLGLFAWLMELDEGEVLIMRTVHADYLEDWTNRVQPLLDRMKLSPLQNLEGRSTDPESIRNRGERTGAALDAILQVDEEFIDEIGAAVGDPAANDGLEATRVQRIFDRIESISGSRFDSAFGMPVIEPVGPYRLLWEMDLDEPTLERGRQALLERNADLRTAVEGWERDRLESDIAYEIAVQPVAFDQDLPDDATVEEVMAATAAASQRYLELANERASRRRSEARDRRGVVEAVVEESLFPELSRMQGLQMRVEMFERGWEGARKTHQGLDIALQVLRLNDLDPDQTTLIETLLLDHLELELELMDRIASETAEKPDPGDSSLSVADKFVFRRGELQERLIQRLLVILNPLQIARIPGLADRPG